MPCLYTLGGDFVELIVDGMMHRELRPAAESSQKMSKPISIEPRGTALVGDLHKNSIRARAVQDFIPIRKTGHCWSPISSSNSFHRFDSLGFFEERTALPRVPRSFRGARA